MEATLIAARSPAEPISVLITDSALESLVAFHAASAENAQRVDALLESIRHGDIRGRVLKLTASPRPIWQCEIAEGYCVYLTIGQGCDAVEARIAFFGPPLPDNTESYRELLFWAGEALYHMLPEQIRVEETRSPAVCPPEALERTNDAIDDLHGRPFRLLTEVRVPIDLPARLSPEQEAILTTPGPILLQGVAGSGKTTLLTHLAHRALVRKNTARIIILAYTESLKHFIDRMLRSLQTLEPVDLSRLEIFTWRELCDMLAASLELKPICWAKPMQFADFVRAALLKKGVAAPAEFIADLGELLRATLKGGNADPQHTLMDRKTFLALPPISLDSHIQRESVYEIVRQYQYFLHCHGLWDDLDAARLLYEYRANRTDLPRYDWVMVDETQDYTLTQLRLTSVLANSSSGLVYTGDTNQVIHPSYFRWETAKTAFYQAWKTAPPALHEIRYNYRNPQPVSAIAERLLELRAQRLEIKAEQSVDSNQATTPLPLRLRVRRGEADAIVRRLAANIGSMGVVQETEQHFAIEGIEFQRAFTPQAVKGLEFNVVCLVGFNTLYRDLAFESRRKLTPRQLFLKFNEAYVSVTRTRGQLILIDPEHDGDGLWDDPAIQQLVTTVEQPEEVIKLVMARYKLTSRDEWRVCALDFESQHAYAPAAESWERAGMPEKAAAAYRTAGRLAKAAALYKALGDFPAAAEIAEELGDYSEAARLHEIRAQWNDAAACWSRAGKHLQAAHAYQSEAERTGDAAAWGEAATHYARAHSPVDAATCFESAMRWSEAADQWSECGRLLDAARCLAQAGRPRDAKRYQARHFEETGQYADAAPLWKDLDEIASACRCWERAGQPERAQELFRAAGQYVESARLLRDMHRYEDAATDYDRLGMIDRAAECLEKAERWAAAGERWAKLGSNKRAIACYERAGQWENVGNLRMLEGNYRKAASAFDLAKQFDAAADAWSKSGDMRKAAIAYENCAKWVEAAECWHRAGDLLKFQECAHRASEIGLDTAPLFQLRPPERPIDIEKALSRLLAKYEPVETATLPVRRSDWEFTVPSTEANRYLVAMARKAQQVNIPALMEAGEAILKQLALQGSPAESRVKESRERLTQALEPIATAVVGGSENIQENSAQVAGLLEYAGKLEGAALLWQRAGDAVEAARCYWGLGRRQQAHDVCLTIADPQKRAAQLQNMGFHAEAALLNLDFGGYLNASRLLDLCGQNELANIAKAIAFEENGETNEAQAMWRSLGFTCTKEDLRAELEAIVHPERSPLVQPTVEADAPVRGPVRRLLERLRAALRWLFGS